MADLIGFRKSVYLFPLLAGLVCWSGCSRDQPEPLRFEVLLEDLPGLQVGSPLQADQQVLGRVTALTRIDEGLLATVEVEPRFRGRLSREADFQVVETPSGGFELRLTDAFGSPPIEDGTRIDARPDWLERLSRGVQAWQDRTRDLAGDVGSSLRSFVQDLTGSEEAQALRDSLLELSSDLATVTRDRYQDFLDKELPALEEKARQHRDKLLAEGHQREAEIFWKWFQRWADTMRGQKQPEEAEAPEQPLPPRPPGQQN